MAESTELVVLKRRGSLAEADAGPRKKYKSISPRPADLSSTGPSDEQENGSTERTDLHLSVSKGHGQKASLACDTCRHKKVKCSESRPTCAYCTRHGFHCSYTNQTGALEKLAVLLDRFSRLEQSLESLRDEVRLRDLAADSATASDPPVFQDAARAVARLYQTPPDTVLSARSPLYCHGPPDSLPEGLPEGLSEGPADSPLPPAPQPDLRYAGTTPFACEERRAPLPNLLAHEPPTEAEDIMPHVDDYLRQPYDLFPLMCKSTAYEIAISVRKDGLQPNLRSCYVLLMVSLSKAYSDPWSASSGLADFQMASQILGRLSRQLSLDYVVVQFLSSIFLLKKGLMINFALSLHAACTSLYTLIKRDRASGIERDTSDRNTISSTFWIGHNLERDLVHEIDGTFPQSSLHLLVDSFILPLGCDVSPGLSVPPTIRDEIMFFLAEMSLRAVMARILAMPAWRTGGIENRILASASAPVSASTSASRTPEVSHLLRELRSQLDEWLLRMPAVLDWSTEPVRGSASPVVARLKILYWFARFSLARPLILRALGDPGLTMHLQAWALFQDGILSALKLFRVFLWEETELDFLMGDRILSVMQLLQAAASKNCVPALESEPPGALLSAGHSLLHQKLARSSEWIACKLYNMQVSSSN